MNLRAAILSDHSKANTQSIVQWIGNESKRIAELIHILLTDEYRVVQRAAWVLSGVAEQHPEAIHQHIPALVEKLKDQTAHIAVKRNVYRILQFLEIPEAVHGDLMNSCFDSLIDPKEALAVRAFAMTILANMSEIYPEIQNEIRLILQDAMRHETAPSFKSRAKKVLKQLK